MKTLLLGFIAGIALCEAAMAESLRSASSGLIASFGEKPMKSESWRAVRQNAVRIEQAYWAITLHRTPRHWAMTAIGAALLAWSALFNATETHGDAKRGAKMMRSATMVVVAAVFTFFSNLLFLPFADAQSITLHHVHGLAYSADGKQILIPSHNGLAVFSGGRWSKAPGPEHDYMGFSATRQFFYSSGHPAQGMGLINPFGLLKSRDGGRNWDKLGLEGEADFHLLATCYDTNAVYVYTHSPNSRMSKPGIYATVNDGFAWKRAESKGLEGESFTLAVHPSNSKTVAAGTKTGLFLSIDGGDNFKRLASGEQVLAAFFDLDGKQLWFSSYSGKPALTRLDWGSGKKTNVSLPPLTQDAVAYIAQNPAGRSEYAIATFERNVYVSKNQGKTWLQIANRGQTTQ